VTIFHILLAALVFGLPLEVEAGEFVSSAVQIHSASPAENAANFAACQPSDFTPISSPENLRKSLENKAVRGPRYLNPQTGRFWTRDLFEGAKYDPDSLHKYLYTENDPINSIDPSGRAPTLGSVLITSALIALDAAFVSQNVVNYRKFFGFTMAQRLRVAAQNAVVVRRLQAIIESDGEITFQQQNLRQGGQLGMLLDGDDDFTHLANLFESFPWNIEGYPSAVVEALSRAGTGIWTAVPNPNTAGSAQTAALAQALLIRNAAFGDWLLRNL